MGLVLEDDGSYAILSDILGDEDHLGDMDFKVAGTENGITSLQMDIKVAGITPEIMEKALAQARTGRMHILGEMNKALSKAGDFSVHAPRIETMTIPTDKIREVIGSGGKVIREIVEVSGAKVDINDDGVIKIASPNGDAIQKAITGANGTPAPSSAAISGITPQEQNGEIAPTSAASSVARHGLPLKASAIRLSARVALANAAIAIASAKKGSICHIDSRVNPRLAGS